LLLGVERPSEHHPGWALWLIRDPGSLSERHIRENKAKQRIRKGENIRTRQIVNFRRRRGAKRSNLLIEVPTTWWGLFLQRRRSGGNRRCSRKTRTAGGAWEGKCEEEARTHRERGASVSHQHKIWGKNEDAKRRAARERGTVNSRKVCDRRGEGERIGTGTVLRG